MLWGQAEETKNLVNDHGSPQLVANHTSHALGGHVFDGLDFPTVLSPGVDRPYEVRKQPDDGTRDERHPRLRALPLLSPKPMVIP